MLTKTQFSGHSSLQLSHDEAWRIGQAAIKFVAHSAVESTALDERLSQGRKRPQAKRVD